MHLSYLRFRSSYNWTFAIFSGRIGLLVFQGWLYPQEWESLSYANLLHFVTSTKFRIAKTPCLIRIPMGCLQGTHVWINKRIIYIYILSSHPQNTNVTLEPAIQYINEYTSYKYIFIYLYTYRCACTNSNSMSIGTQGLCNFFVVQPLLESHTPRKGVWPHNRSSEFGLFCCSNLGMANQALADEVMRWPLRPKQHQFEHLVFDFGLWGNPRHFSCMLDEDLIGRLKKITLHTHPKTMSVRALEHYSICAASVWVGNLMGWNDGGKKNVLAMHPDFSCWCVKQWVLWMGTLVHI